MPTAPHTHTISPQRPQLNHQHRQSTTNDNNWSTNKLYKQTSIHGKIKIQSQNNVNIFNIKHEVCTETHTRLKKNPVRCLTVLFAFVRSATYSMHYQNVHKMFEFINAPTWLCTSVFAWWVCGVKIFPEVSALRAAIKVMIQNVYITLNIHISTDTTFTAGWPGHMLANHMLGSHWQYNYWLEDKQKQQLTW